MLAIIKKELKTYFLTPIGWTYIGIFLTLCSLFFFTDIFRYKTSVFSDIFGVTISTLTVLIPILTMRTFSEERKNGTDQLLLTSPRSIKEIVLGKFLGATIVVLISALLTFVYYLILLYFGKPELITTLNVLIGYILISLVYISIGIFCSSLTENQIIAAVLSVGILLILSTLSTVIIPLKNYSPLNAFFSSFYNGISSLKDYVLLLTYILMFLGFTIISIQRRKNTK